MPQLGSNQPQGCSILHSARRLAKKTSLKSVQALLLLLLVPQQSVRATAATCTYPLLLTC